jgi:tetratricopeptide (TPR) repeat protein
MQTDYDNNLQSYFTDMEHLRDMFKDFVSTEKLPKRLIVFHGVGGVGKSSLLRMFRLHCKSEKIPVGLASGDDAKSVLDVITRWTEDLKEDGIKFPSLSKTLESYRSIQAKVDDQAKKSQNKAADMASKAASKTAEAAGGALVGAAIGSIIPGLGTAIGGLVGSTIGSMGAEALFDWMRGFLNKSEIDLLLDPTKKLSTDFLEDIAKAAEKKRIVLLLDTYEQMSALEDWVGEVAQKIQPNVLMVIAGRKLPDWNRFWPGWMMNAQVEELKPMTEEVMRELIRRYYATMRGGEPDPAQVEAIIRFARGLPMVVTSAVQLWVKYGVEDFQSVKAEIVANLVDRLMEGVPSSLIPALEAAAVVRWFDQPILRAVLNKEDVRDVYNELRRFPFVRSRAEGLALHDSVREMMDENLRMQDSERHTELHERAAAYFEKKLEKVTGEEAERLGLERLYHRIRADEETGINLFQEMAEELTQFRLTDRLFFLLNEINNVPLEFPNSILWKAYYNAQLAQIELRLDDAMTTYEMISKRPQISSKLHAYTLCEWGSMLTMYEHLGKVGGVQIARDILSQSLELHAIDSHLVTSLLKLARVARYEGDWLAHDKFLERAVSYFQEKEDGYGLAFVFSEKRKGFGARGFWKDFLLSEKYALSCIENSLREPTVLKAILIGSWVDTWVFIGRYNEAEQKTRKALILAERARDDLLAFQIQNNLARALGFQEKYLESEKHFDQNLKLAQQLGESQYRSEIAFILGAKGQVLGLKGENSALLYLDESLKIREELKLGTPSLAANTWKGSILETQQRWQEAQETYNKCLKLTGFQNYYFESATLTGLIRVKHAQGDLAAIPSLLTEAKQLAQQYEYNDHLASLRLTQGHLAWESSKMDEVMSFYQHAMIYALRYNRFLLDELLSGRPQGTPLRPIIPNCLERGEDGKKILIALHDWWKIGVNDIGTPRPDTISPIPEGIPLLEAEKIAREREPGDGSMQKSVIEQLEAVL